MKIFKMLISALCMMSILALPLSAGAISFGEPDCTDSSNPATCGHTNVVMLSGWLLDAENNLFSGFQCSGSLLKKNDDMIIILTAAHCTADMKGYLDAGILVDLGVTFEAEPTKVDGSTFLFKPDQFILGGIPVTAKVFPAPAPTTNWLDYGLVVFPIVNGDGEPLTHAENPVNLDDVDVIQLPPLGYLETLVQNEDTWINVGYGVDSAHNAPGEEPTRGPKSIFSFNDKTDAVFGVRSVSESLFIAFMEKGRFMILGQQNPARDQGGICPGDSGGPQFIDIDEVETQISITSQGICRSIGVNARLDIPEAQDFIQECAYDADTVEDVTECSLGCVELEGGVCPQ